MAVPSVGQEELVAGFNSLGVRNVYWMDFTGPARVSSVLPTYWSWHKEKPQQLGADIEQLLEEGDTSLRIYSIADGAIMRRKQTESLFRKRPLTWSIKGDPIPAAEVTGVSNIDVGFGRTLPVLRLMEFTSFPAAKEPVISVAELAKHVQKKEVELVLR